MAKQNPQISPPQSSTSSPNRSLMTTAKEEPAAAADSEELDPLFEYTRAKPIIAFRFDDTDLEKSEIFAHCNKRRKVGGADADVVEGDKAVEQGAAGVKVATAVNLDEENWLPPPPPKPVLRAEVQKDSALQELRLKKQELAKIAGSADDAVQKIVESAKKDLGVKKAPEHIVLDEKPERQVPKVREKLVITIQEKDGHQQFRVNKDDKLDKLFKVYTKKAKLSLSDLTFVFDGDKVDPASTPEELGLEDGDMIEVRHKRC